MRLVLIGQAPGPRSGPRPFDGRSGDRLATYMGMDGRLDLFARMECLNLLRSYPGSTGGKGDRFPRSRAMTAARRLLGRLEGCSVLLAGKNVAAAFRVRSDYLAWEDHVAGGRFAVIPHPSGVNHWWNDEANRHKFRGWADMVLREAT